LNQAQPGSKIHVLSTAPCYLEIEMYHKIKREDWAVQGRLPGGGGDLEGK